MKKFFLLSAALMAVGAMSAQDFDVYVIGSNVNGGSWATGAPDAKMTFVGDGIYEWDGEFLGTGFKLNDGTWSNPDHNWGAGEGELSLGVPYGPLTASGTSGNIGLDGFTGVKNPHVVFDANTAMITVTGEADGKYEWYLVGDFNEFRGPAEDGEGVVKYTEIGDKVYAYEGVEFTTGDTTIKMSDTGWHKQYGDNEAMIQWGVTTVLADGKTNQAVLQECGSEGTMPCFLFGKYNSEWDLNTLTLTFRDAEDSGVKAFEAVNGEAEYFNLQGVKVNEPANGLFIKVINGKATKVAIR